MHDQIKNNALNLINLKNSQGFTQTGAIIESQYSVEFLSWLSTQGYSGEITFCGYPQTIDWSTYVGTDTSVSASTVKVISLERDWKYGVNIGDESKGEYILGSNGTMNSFIISGLGN